MKNVSFLILFVILLSGCKKVSTTDAPVVVTSYVGQTFSAYSFTSSFDGHKMYNGYRFTSSTKAVELLLDENTKIISQTEVAYSGTYPNFKIAGENTANGFWDAFFISESILQVRGLLMKKW
ncbi:MAG: hypothetical protein NTZ69_15785 [Bacteroidia bacterium]|nr:hypothetical protein [Bacteroidia bacterium]